MISHQEARWREDLPLSAGQVRAALVVVAGNAVEATRHGRHDVASARVQYGPCDGRFVVEEPELAGPDAFPHDELETEEVLEQCPDPSTPLFRRDIREVGPIDEDLPARRRVQTAEQLYERRFPRSE